MIYNTDIAQQVAAHLLEAEAVKLSPQNPFTWSSGWKSPIYCDNRVLLSYPNIRTYIKNNFVSTIQSYFKNTEVIAGVATAGIAHAALIADSMDLPMAYVRSSRKSHGTQSQIEGRIVKGSKVMVIEDLISTGGSSLKVVEALRAEGHEVVGLGAIFTYGLDVADQAMKDAGLSHFTLSDYQHLLKVARQKSYIQPTDSGTLEEWRKAPADWKG